MVIVNTQSCKTYDNLTFRYLMDVPRCDCLYGSARESGGRAHLFLVFNAAGRIYKRKNGSWIEITGAAEYSEIRHALRETIKYERAPRFSNINLN